DHSRWAFEGTRAVGLASSGRTLEAARAGEAAKSAAVTGRYETLRLELALADAVVARELDHRDEAARTLADLVRAPAYADPVIQLVAQVELAQLRMSTGDLEGAADQLASAEAWLERLRGGADSARSDVVPDASPGDLVARTGVDLALAMDD